jgi:Tfp pilus assembly protein PilN
VESPTKTEPPFVPLRRTGWASRRTPMWVFAAIIVLAAGVALVSLSHKPSQAQRASDLTAYLGDVNAGIESCAGGVRDSLQALNAVEGGSTSRYQAAVGILTYNAQNCSPANNQPLQDFTNYQVTESLAAFPLDKADNDIVTWAFPDAMNAQQDMLAVLRAKTPAARAGARATLQAAMRAMDTQRTAIYAIWRDAEKAVGASAPLPYLPV